MATRPDNKTTLRLAVELLKRIPRRRKISAKELQEQLRDAGIERTLRSIQRQLAPHHNFILHFHFLILHT